MQFKANFSADIPHLLNELNISLIFSTYQAGKVIVIGSDGQYPYQLVRDFDRPMGMAFQKDMMALACSMSVTVFKNDHQLAVTYPKKPNTYDAFFFPVQSNRTDFIDMHDLAYTSQGLVGVNTAYSCLSRIDGQYSFNPIWKPFFISDLVSNDKCHLNGLAVDSRGDISYVTAFSDTDVKDGWRTNKLQGGVLVDVPNNKIILRNLPMPHSPRLYQGDLYVLLSASEKLVKIDVESGSYTTIAKIDGFIRGLSFVDNYAVIGVSKLRKTHTFADLPIARKKLSAGVVIVDLTSGDIVGEIKYGSDVDEIYDVQVLHGIRRANIMNFIQSIQHRALITPFGSGWVDANKENQLSMELNNA